jgi:putative flippase GtrA
MLADIIARAKARGLPYLIVGAANTALGYGVTVGLYYLLRGWPIVAVATLANVVCITVSFVTYKVFIFKSGGFWLPEYLRCYLVYGGGALLGIAGLWLLVDVLGLTIWLSQGLVMAAVVPLSFFGHEFFTFRMRCRLSEQPETTPTRSVVL